MTTSAAFSDAIRSLVRVFKENSGGEDLPTSLFLWRDDLPFGWISGPSPQAVLSAGALSIAAHAPQFTVFVLDSVVPLVADNPQTGQKWERGEALAYLEDLDADERAEQDIARDCLTMCVTESDGEQSGLIDLYKIVADQCIWTGEGSEYSTNSMRVPALADAMRGARINPAQVRDPGDGFVAAPDAPFMTAERGRMTLDIGMTRHVETQFREQGVSMLLFAYSDEHDEFLRGEGLPDWQILAVG